MSLVSSVLTVVRGLRLMVVAVMRRRMIGNMASSVTMGVMIAGVLEIAPLALPGLQQAGGGRGGALKRE